jgi:hypothetical protein
MMTSRLASAVLCAAVVLAGCGGNEGSMSAQPLAFSDLAASAYSGVITQRQVAAYDTTTWATLWAEHTSNTEASPPPQVDFSRQTVAAVFAGQATACERVQVESVTATNNTALVAYRIVVSEPGATCTAAVTTPVHMVAFENPDRLPVAFRDVSGGLSEFELLSGASQSTTCVGNACKAGDAEPEGGPCYGHYCGGGFGNTHGGSCLGDGCQAGNAHTLGGNCYGAGCRAGNAYARGGDCYGEGCIPGHGGNRSGAAYAAQMNTGCILGELYRFPGTRPQDLSNWYLEPGAAACYSITTFDKNGWAVKVQISPAKPPVPVPTVTITPLPPNPYD